MQKKKKPFHTIWKKQDGSTAETLAKSIVVIGTKGKKISITPKSDIVFDMHTPLNNSMWLTGTRILTRYLLDNEHKKKKEGT